MFKLPSKFTKLLTLLIVVVAASSLFTPSTASAARYKQLCDLNVFPYNPSPITSIIIGPLGTNYINNLESVCFQHLTFPTATSPQTPYSYRPQPPTRQDNPIKAGSQDVRVPVAQHQHAYFEDSNHLTPSTEYFYKSFMERFEITLQADGFNNIALNAITCDTPVPPEYNGDPSDLFDCNGYAPDLYGGTRVTMVPSGNTVVITWDFANGGNFGGRPQIYGDNGPAFQVFDNNGNSLITLNLNDPENRKRQFGVNLPTKDNGDVWSATTTARALISHLALKKTNYPRNFALGCVGTDVNNAGSGWCYLPPPNASSPREQITTPSGTYTYYWHPIGVVGSVWHKPQPVAPPPPPDVPPPPPVLPPPPPVLPPPPPRIKEADLFKAAVETNHRSKIVRQGDRIEFKVTFVPVSAPVGEVTIHDSMSRGTLVGNKGSVIRREDGPGGEDFRVEARRRNGAAGRVFKCVTTPPPPGVAVPRVPRAPQLCYEGSPFEVDGITFKNVIDETLIITYFGRLTSSVITDAFCRRNIRDKLECGEKFINEVWDTFGNRANAILFTPCPFLLTQGIGDVILEDDFRVGSDISGCAIPNIEGPVIITPPPPPPPPPGVVKTGKGDLSDLLSDIPRPAPHGVCEKSNLKPGDPNYDPSIPQAYRNPLQSLSSDICEVSLTLADVLSKPRIRSDVSENITRITRYNNNLGIGVSRSVDNLNDPILDSRYPNPNPNSAIYKLENGNLTVGGGPQVGKGSRTYVVENGDLIINSNIEYEDTDFGIDSIKEIPSIAFIVINGNIRISKNVTKLSGVFITLNMGKAGTGKITSADNESTNNQLLIEGSVYGDIEPLFEKRTYAGGNPLLGEGSIVINYDGRLFYNLPPGLKEILEIESQQVVR